MQSTKESYTGCPIFRAAEAYLNYIEAYYELNGNLGGNCDKYWKALRTRAGMSTDYQKTINNTDISKEKQDWGSYSAGQQINTTLYNIRRERRVESFCMGACIIKVRALLAMVGSGVGRAYSAASGIHTAIWSAPRLFHVE